MNTLKLVNKQNVEIITIVSAVVPDVGEYIWINKSVKNPDSRKIIGRVFDLNERLGKLDITLIVE